MQGSCTFYKYKFHDLSMKKKKKIKIHDLSSDDII